MPAPESLKGRRVAASVAALNSARWPQGALVLRLAPDEVLVIGEGAISLDDVHAIVEEDSSFTVVELSPSEAGSVLAGRSDWEPPTAVPSLAQGLVAALPAKVWFEQDRVLLIVPTPYAHELEERLR